MVQRGENGDGFAMLSIMHTYMIDNLIGDQAKIIVRSALHAILQIRFEPNNSGAEHIYVTTMQEYSAAIEHANVQIKDEKLLATLTALVKAWPTDISGPILSTLEASRAVVAAGLTTSGEATTADIWKTTDSPRTKRDAHKDLRQFDAAIRSSPPRARSDG